MKPQNKFQAQVLEASKTLPLITIAQAKWAYQNCFEHFGVRTKKGNITCLECGYAWNSKNTLVIERICGCTCPNCRMELKIKETRKRVFNDSQYFCIITTCKGFQVLRYLYVKYYAKIGQKVNYFHSEVTQRWLAPDGRNAIVSKLQTVSYFGENWSLSSKLEIRQKRSVS